MKEQNRRRIDIISSAEFTNDLDSLDLDELRSRRQMCSDLDTELSYYRRLLHGRMDILGFESRRRTGEEKRSLLEALPEILAHGASVGGAFPERAVPVEAPEIPAVGRRAVDKVLGDDFIARLPDLTEEEITEAQARLTEVETGVSDQRRTVHGAIDILQAELTRRYREGLSDPADLLRS